jgi:SPP1 gp7 family putative phage head morphogenesis protein
MSTTTTYRILHSFAVDPTHTLTLRRAFVRDMNRRFAELMKVIKEAIVDQDCFGLQVQTYAALTPPTPQQFNFPRTADKVEAFMEWLRRQIDKGLLETATYQRIGTAMESAWTDIYIQDSYKRGIQRARSEMRKAGYAIPSADPFNTVEAIMSTPFHVDRVGLVYTRTFSKLKGITTAMDAQISEVLAQGLVDGDNANVLAKKLLSTITGAGNAELGITDTLGRYIPARRRAQTLARTEVVRAHHQANIQEYKNWGVEGVEVIAEFVTAGDDRVCTECAGYHGNRYTLEVAENLIPVHPNCRCIVIPVDKRDVTGKIIG